MKQLRHLALYIIVLAGIFTLGEARSDDDYALSFSEGILTTQTVVMYDECVKKGYIVNPGASAEDRFQATIDRMKVDPHLRRGMSAEQKALAMQKAFDMSREIFKQHHIPVDTGKCRYIYKTWPSFSLLHGIE